MNLSSPHSPAIIPGLELVAPRERVEVLLVDDREENLLALETVLASEHYHLVRAHSGDEALRYLLDQEPALILMDVQMPGLDGYETVSIIKGSERTKIIPIIFITALNKDDRYVLKGYQHGAIDYLYKPYDPVVLRSKVSVLADLARKSKSLILVERQLRESERREREREIALLELKNLKREQAEQKKYLDLASGITHGIVWSIDAHSQMVNFVSPSTEGILGYTAEEWTRQPAFLTSLILPSDRALFLESLEQCKTTSLPIKFQHRMIHLQGQEIWCQTEIRSTARPDIRAQEIRGLSIDISELKASQNALAKSKQRSDMLAQGSFILSQSFDWLGNLKEMGKLVVDNFADAFLLFKETEVGQFEYLDHAYAPHKKWNLQEVEMGLRSMNPEFSDLGLIKPALEPDSHSLPLFNPQFFRASR